MNSNIVKKLIALIASGEATEANIRKALFPIEAAIAAALPLWRSSHDELYVLRKRLGCEHNNDGDPGRGRESDVLEYLQIAASMFREK